MDRTAPAGKRARIGPVARLHNGKPARSSDAGSGVIRKTKTQGLAGLLGTRADHGLSDTMGIWHDIKVFIQD